MTNTEEIFQKLQSRTNGQSQLSIETIGQFINYGKIEQASPNQILQRAGARVEKIYIPLDAPLNGLDPDTSDLKRQFFIGELIGLPEALSTERFPWVLRTGSQGQLLSVTAANLRSLIDHDPQIRWQMLQYLAQNLRAATTTSQSRIEANPGKRLALILAEYAEKYGKPSDKGIELHTKISQQELGDRIGASRQTVNKYFGEFIDANLIQKSGHRYFIVDLISLKNFNNSN